MLRKVLKNDFNVFKDFYEFDIIVSIFVVWMEFLGMDSFEGKLSIEIECEIIICFYLQWLIM